MSEQSVPNSYQYLINDGYFMEGDINLAPDIFVDRFEKIFKMLQTLIVKYKLEEYCAVNPRLLEIAIMDYFADITRLKEFHNTLHIQRDKIYAYEAYWLLKNRPIQLIKDDNNMDDEQIHVNEFILSYLFVSLLATELDSRLKSEIQIDNFIKKLEASKFTLELRLKLYYTFRHRPLTAQTLLLAFESYLSAAQFAMQIT